MLIYIIIVCILILIALGGFYLYSSRKTQEQVQFFVPEEISMAMQEFKSEIDTVSESVRLLEGFVSDYFMTLNESGFRELCDISEALSSAFALCNSLLEEEKLQEAQGILEYVFNNKGSGTPPQNLIDLLPKSAPFLASWSKRARERVEVIENKLSHASRQFQEIGTVRKRNRSPTSTILGEVRSKVFGAAKDGAKIGKDKP